MLFSADRHESAVAAPWDEALIRAEIKAIARAAETAWQPHAWWPHHPRDEDDTGKAPNKTLYLGAAGVLWALELLAAKGLIESKLVRPELWAQICDEYLSTPDTGEVVPSWFLGRSFPLLLAMLRGPQDRRDAHADALYETIAGNLDNKTWELLWGSPGTMLAALAAFEGTGESRWANLYRRHADRLWDEWHFREDLGCDLWTQDLYGQVVAYFGVGHGFAGNVHALLRGRRLLSEARGDALAARAARTMKKLAVRADGRANWPVSDRDLRRTRHLQWCHGAPGFVMTFGKHYRAGYDAELDTLLAEGGELIWAAGPLTKGACFCHGTDGNGMALLTLYERTGDTRWLDRARAFAMAAVAQSRQNLAVYGDRRYTLWTGDLGLAVYLAACLDGQAHSPTLDFV